jgi:hypothetical protein
MSNTHVHPMFGRLLGGIFRPEQEKPAHRSEVAKCVECNKNPVEIDGRCESCSMCVAGAKG